MELGGNIKKISKRLGFFVALLAISISFSSNVLAFMIVYGDGTAENPKLISTCSQLDSWINNIPGTTINNLSFLITNNLDCTGYTFDNTTTLIYSTIDGGNHKIVNLKLGVNSGLVYRLDNSTIKNLWLATGDNDGMGTLLGGSFANQMVNSELNNVRSSINLNCANYCGGLVGFAQDSTITKAVYDGTLNAGHSSGGLVGSDTFNKTTNLTITKSAFLGTMIALQNSGGILGALAENVAIENSYASGNLTLGPFSGGIIGGYNDIVTIINSYADSTGSVDIYGGGIIGGYNSNVTIMHSYASLISSDFLVGGGEGANNTNVNYSDVHYTDLTATYCKSGSTDPVTGCSVAGPYISDSLIVSMGFNLIDIWQKEIGKNPTLRLTEFNDPADIPNGGDMNDDGIQDTFQGNVELLKNSSGYWIAVETDGTKNCILDDANLLNTAGVPTYSGYNVSSDFVGFNAYCLSAGESLTTKIYLNRNIDISKAQLMFYNPTSKTYTKISGATFAHQTIGGQTFTVLSYTLTDGGPYDLDGASNGKIEDPIVLALPKATSTNGGGGSSNTATNYLTSSWTYGSDETTSNSTSPIALTEPQTTSSNNPNSPSTNDDRSSSSDIVKIISDNFIWIFIAIAGFALLIFVGFKINKYIAR